MQGGRDSEGMGWMEPLSRWGMNADCSPGNQTNVTLRSIHHIHQALSPALHRLTHKLLWKMGNITSILQ